MGSLDRFAAEKLAALSARALRRELAGSARAPAAKLSRDGRQLISFSCNDYLNLSTHPRVIEAAVAATRQYGAGAGGSRAITGNHPLVCSCSKPGSRRASTLPKPVLSSAPAIWQITGSSRR